MAEALVRLTADAWEVPKPQRTAMVGHVEPVRIKAGGLGYGQLLSAITSGGFALVDLGVAEITVLGGRGSSWRYLIDGDMVAEFVADRSKSATHKMLSFDEVAEAFIQCAEHFGFISTVREPFVPHDDMLPVMRAFARNGYAWEREAYFLWTAAIGEAMQRAGAWNENNVPFQEIWDRDIDADLSMALKSVPYDVRDAAHRGDVLEVWVSLCSRWHDGIWAAELPWEQKLALTGGVCRAKRFVEMIVGDTKPGATQ